MSFTSEEKARTELKYRIERYKGEWKIIHGLGNNYGETFKVYPGEKELTI
jgi:hypothetical protein